MKGSLTYGGEKWNLSFRAQKRLLILENRALRRILESKRDRVAGRLGLRFYEEIRRLTEQPLISKVQGS